MVSTLVQQVKLEHARYGRKAFAGVFLYQTISRDFERGNTGDWNGLECCGFRNCVLHLLCPFLVFCWLDRSDSDTPELIRFQTKLLSTRISLEQQQGEQTSAQHI